MLTGRAAWEPGWAIAFRTCQPCRLWAKLPEEPRTAWGPGSRGLVCPGLTGPGQCGHAVRTRLKHNKLEAWCHVRDSVDARWAHMAAALSF